MKKLFISAIYCTLGLLVLARPSVAAQGDWPTHRGNAERTGNTDAQPGPKTPKVLWVYKSAEHYVASRVPGAELIYLGGLGAFNTGVFKAVAVQQNASERVVWSKTAPYIKRPTICAPAVIDGLAVFGDGMHRTDNATVYCVRADNGSPVWQYPVSGKLVRIVGSPTVSKGRVYVGAGRAGVLCLDLERVSMEDKPTPKLLWQRGKDNFHVDAPLAVSPGGRYVLVASAYLDEEKVGRRGVLCLEAADGSVKWEVILDVNPWAGPTVSGNTVLVGCSSIRFDRKLIHKATGEVIAYILNQGKVLWRHKTGGGVLSAIAVKDGLAVYTCTDGKVTARKCDTGKLVWKYDAKCPFFAGPALAGDVVYAADLKTVVHAINLADGKKLWSFDAGCDPAVRTHASVFGSPIVSQGKLYLATCNLEGQADQPSAVICLSD